MGPSSERVREQAEEPGPDLKSETPGEPFEPSPDVYATTELANRAERMERMIEKARESI